MWEDGGTSPPATIPKPSPKSISGPGDSRVGWVYFAVHVTGGAPKDFGAPNEFQYTAKSADVAAEGDTGQWRWTPIRHWLF